MGSITTGISTAISQYSSTLISLKELILQFGFSPGTLVLVVTGLLGLIELVVYKITMNVVLTLLVGMPVLVVAVMLNLLPVWLACVMGIPMSFLGIYSLVNIITADDFGSGPVEKEERKTTVNTSTSGKSVWNELNKDGATRDNVGRVIETLERRAKEDTDLTNQLIQKQVREIQEQKARTETWPSGLPKTAPVAVPTFAALEDRVSSSLSGFDKGRKAFSSLKSEYDGLVMLFGGSRVSDTLINTERTKQIVADVYSKGLSFIEQAANVFKQIKLSDYDTLKMETDELSGELQAKSADSAVYKTLKQVIDKNNNILSLVKKNQDSIDELLAQSTLCKDSIEEIRLQLPCIVNYQSAEELEKPLAELKQRIDFAQKLQTEFKAQGL